MDCDSLGVVTLWVDLNHSRRLGHMLIIVLHSNPVFTYTQTQTVMDMHIPKRDRLHTYATTYIVQLKLFFL